MRADELVEVAARTLGASPAIDHWQSDRDLLDAQELLDHVLGREFHPEEEIARPVRRRFERLVDRRATGEPIPYIKGYSEFRGLRVPARPGVFVPRDSTEFLAAQAIRRLRRRRHPVAVDLATGGGPVALAIANEVPGASVYGTDIAADAVALARTSARKLGLTAHFVRGDLLDGLPRALAGSVDVITLHPPYVAQGELRHLPDEVRRFEPVHTLTDHSVDGLGLVERAASEGGTWLSPGGWLLVEVSPDRARGVATRLRQAGFVDVRSTKDDAFKVTRVIVGKRP